MIHIYTDGGCSGNPGPGGWAYVMLEKTLEGDSIKAEEYGAVPDTTNNRMELLAVIKALKALKGQKAPERELSLYTDSQYVHKGISEWIHNWKRNLWRTSDKKPVKNQDLWVELDALAGEFSISWVWVKGHSGNKFNELCDSLTQKAIASLP